MIFGLIVEILISFLHISVLDNHNLVEPLYSPDVSYFFLDTDAHLRQIVLDDTTQSLHSSSVEIGDDRYRGEQQNDVSGECGRDIQHQLRMKSRDSLYSERSDCLH